MRVHIPVPWEGEVDSGAEGSSLPAPMTAPESPCAASEAPTLTGHGGSVVSEISMTGALTSSGQTLRSGVPPFALPSLRSRLLSWRTIIPLVAMLIVLGLAGEQLRLALDPASIAAVIFHINGWFFLGAFAAFYGSLLLRVLRWKLLLENVGYRKERGIHLPNFLHLTKILFLSWFANVVVPAKLGDIYRAYLLRQDADVSVSRSFGTVLAERILELVTLLLLFLSAILISLRGQLPDQLELALRVGLGLVLGVIIGLVALHLYREQIGRLVPARFHAQYVQFQEGTLGSFRRLHLLGPLSVAVWVVESLRFLLVALAVGLLSGDPLHIFAAALFIALGESLLTTVPLTSGGVGFVEAGMFAMLLLFTPDTAAAHNTAASAILLDRLISLVSILVFGSMLFGVVTVRGNRQGKARMQRQAGARNGRAP